MGPLIMSLLALFAMSGPAAHAHTELSESTPADQAVLDTAPEEIVLTFSEPVRLTALSVQKRGDARQALGPLPSETSERFAVAAPGLTAGEYLVSWRIVSADMHVMSGEFSFVVTESSSSSHSHWLAARAPVPE